MALQLRRGVDADRSGLTPAEGELIYVTDTKKVWVGDGSTVGGVEFALSSNLQNVVEDVSPQLGGNLDLNSNNIVGVGNINVTGTITASGNINLGDGSGSDQISVGGELTGGLVPSANGAYDIGTTALRWNTLNANSANISGQIDAGAINANVVADDSSIMVNVSNNIFTGAFAGNVTGNVLGNITGYHTGDVTGSVFADNSTLLVDAVAGTIPGANISGTLTNSLTGDATGNHSGTFTGEVIGSVFSDDSSVLVDAVAGKIVGGYENGASFISSTEITSATLKAVGSDTNGTVIIQNNSSSALADQANLGRILYRENENTPYWTVGVTKDYYTMFPNPTGTPDYTKFAQVWKNGKFQIGGEAGGSGFVGWEREPAAQLEVTGNVKVNGAFELLLGNMTTTQRDALTAANGMIVYNTTLNKFQGYENGAWANLI